MSNNSRRKRFLLAFILALLSLIQTASGQDKRIYLAMDDHTDYMWTADEATYQQAFVDMLDYYLTLAEQSQGESPDFQSRFNTDGTYWIRTYEQKKSSADFSRLIGYIRSGHISVPLVPLVLVYGGTPTEAVLRGMYYAGQLERAYGLSFPLGQAMENQVLPYGLGALFAGSGAKYSWRGICACLTQVPSAGDRPHDIYRWVGPDGSSLLVKWNSMLVSNQSMGGYAEARDPWGIVDYVDTNSSFKARYPYPVIGAFGYGWDDLKSLTDVFPQVARAKTTSSRRVIVSNEADFFADFEASTSQSLPTESVTYGNEWELYIASLAEVTASVKRSTEALRTAEAMAAMVSLEQPSFTDSYRETRKDAQLKMGLYYEHNWVGGGSVSSDSRIAWQRSQAQSVKSYVDTLRTASSQALGSLIATSGPSERFFVFNPLSFSRSDVADYAYTGATPISVFDLTTGLEVPSQRVTVSGQSIVRILASDVPPVGYKVFEIRASSGSAFSNAATVTGNVIENDIYKITFSDRGAVTSLVDKAHGSLELVRAYQGRSVNDLGSGTGTIQALEVGPVTASLVATSSSPLAHTTRITLIRGSDRIDLRNEVTQNFSSVYTWGYGFNLDTPTVWHEEVGAIIKAKLESAGGHYATRNARYDWMTLNHFLDMSRGDGLVGVTLSAADSSFFKLGASSVGTLDATTPFVAPLLGGQVDGTWLGMPSQGGDSYFLQRFALRGHGTYDPAAAMRFALEHQNPLSTGKVTGGGRYPETTHSMLSVSSNEVLLWSVKPAEDGMSSGLVLRFWNQASSPRTFTVSFGAPLAAVRKATHLETPLSPLPASGQSVECTVNAQQLLTLLVDLEGPVATPPPDGPTPTAVPTATPATGDDDTDPNPGNCSNATVNRLEGAGVAPAEPSSGERRLPAGLLAVVASSLVWLGLRRWSRRM